MVGVLLHLCELGDTRPSGGYSLPVVGDGSAQLLGGVVVVGDGEPLVLVPGAGLRVLLVLLHARARAGRVQMYRYAGRSNEQVCRQKVVPRFM